jgi:hypothetical protein
MYHSGRVDGLATRRQVSDRHADMVAIVTRMVPHSKPLKGLRKLSQFVEMPGFRMWTALLGNSQHVNSSRDEIWPVFVDPAAVNRM